MRNDRRREQADGDLEPTTAEAPAVGKRTLSPGAPVQRQATGPRAPIAAGPAHDPQPAAPADDPFWFATAAPVQALEGGLDGEGTAVASLAARGVASASSDLPHLDPIQRSFGHHDVGAVRAQVGGDGAEAARSIGASAYATGDRVAFAGAPDLFTAAHEAAHVVQQRNGVHFRTADAGGGEPDWLEDHADQVAHRVVAGQPAVDLLDQVAPAAATVGSAAAEAPIQRMRVFRQKDGAWRLPTGLKENGGPKVTNLDGLGDYVSKMCHVETDDLSPRDRERVIELIAKSGDGGLARQIRTQIGGSIYVEAKEVDGHHQELAELLGPLVDGVKLELVPSLLKDLRKATSILKDHSDRLIINARDLGGQAGLLKQLGGDQLDVTTAIEHFERALIELKDEPGDTLVKYERTTVKYKKSLALARKIKETTAYSDLTKGIQWKSEKLDEVSPRDEVEEELPKDEEESRSEQILKLSQLNIQRLKKAVSLDGEPGGLYQRLLELPWVIKHATGAFNAIANSGVLSSLTELRTIGAGQKASGMSSNKNVESKGDGGFAFFRMDSNNDPMETRYGATTIIGDGSILEDANGWVSLHDQLVPLDRPAMKKLDWKGETQRTSKHDKEHVKSGTQTQWVNEYPQNKDQKPVVTSFLDEVFCGKDILPGIALSVLLELQRIGGKFQEQAYGLTEPGDLRTLVSSLFRIEAKLPWSWQLDEQKSKQVYNPDGDGRYLRSGLIHPEGMAAGAAYDGCKRHQTMIDGVLEALGRDLTAERRAEELRKLLGFSRGMIDQRRDALELAKVFREAVGKEVEKDDSDENQARFEITAKVIKERRKQLDEAEKDHQGWEQQRLQVQLSRGGDKVERYQQLKTKFQQTQQHELELLTERERTGSNNDIWDDDFERITSEETKELKLLERTLIEK